MFGFAHIDEGIVLYMQRRFPEALARFHRILRDAPQQTHTYIFIGKVHAESGEYEQALDALGRMGPQPERPDVQATLGYIYARMGREADARRQLTLLDSLITLQIASPFHKAAVHVGLGEHGRALDLLEQAVERPTWQLRLLKVEPLFDPLQVEPRFQALLERLNLAS